MAIEEVRELLNRFQAGYTARDLSALDAFMELFASDAALEVIGTSAVAPGEGEWCRTRESVRQLIAGDWEYWGDVRFDLDDAHIEVRGEVAWLTTWGTVTDTIAAAECYQDYLEFAESVLQKEGQSAQRKVLELVQLGSDVVLSLQGGEHHTWPFRLSGVAVHEVGGWKLQQLHFSFATTRAPDVRYH